MTYEQALDRARSRLRTQLVELEANLERHAKKTNAGGTNYGFIGDLHHVENALAEINSYLDPEKGEFYYDEGRRCSAFKF